MFFMFWETYMIIIQSQFFSFRYEYDALIYIYDFMH